MSRWCELLRSSQPLVGSDSSSVGLGVGGMWVFVGVLLVATVAAGQQSMFTDLNTEFHFPAGSAMGIFVALAVPLDLPKKNVFVAWNIEANYPLPANDTEVSLLPPIIARDRRARSHLYTSIENHLQRAGYAGRACLLRSICESVGVDWELLNGIYGELIELILTPSLSDDDLDDVYRDAEWLGGKGRCSWYHDHCPVNLLDIFSTLGHQFGWL